jgi:hypothetical protein|tara:strand:+ start:282 stop:554 length:273 start_codon:yes stop_codon:yes gene_type:complete
MVAKRYQNKSGGLNQAGRDFFKRTEGSNLKSPVSKGTNPRRVSFAARFSKVKGPLMKDGKPTRLKLALKKWGFGSKEAAAKFAANNKARA